MRITARQLRQIIKEELARTGFGRLREGAGENARIALSSYLEMKDFADDAIQVGDKLDDIMDGNLVIKRGDKGQIVTGIQALVHGKLMQALKNKSPFTHAASPEGEAEITSVLQGMDTDGDFGPATEKAVIALQKVQKADALKRFNKLAAGSPELTTIDGKVGRQTLTFLLSGEQGASITGQLRKAAPVEQKEDMLSKSKLLAALNDPTTAKSISDAINMTPEQLKKLSELIGDEVPHPLSWWISYLQYNSNNPDAEVDMIALQNAIDQVSGKREPGNIGPARSASKNSTTDSMNEGHDLTARLMNRWIK